MFQIFNNCYEMWNYCCNMLPFVVPLGILAASETEALSSMSPSGGPFRRLGLGFRSGNCVRRAVGDVKTIQQHMIL